MPRISKLNIEGYKSIRKLKDFELNYGLNVLIGSNGAGKSNFISFFKFLNSIINERVQLVTKKQGGANKILYNGSKITPSFKGEVYFELNGYIFNLEPAQGGGFVFETERLYFKGPRFGASNYELGSGHDETGLYQFPKSDWGYTTVKGYVIPALKSWIVYHFHDTGDNARVKQFCDINNNIELETDAGNLAAFLLKLKVQHPLKFEGIEKAVQLIVPYFKSFVLRPDTFDPSVVQLEWQSKDSDQPFTAHQLSDGTIRFICIATVLLRPDPPATIIIDEPELGLHPYALTVLGSMLRSSSNNCQIILSTQSVQLVNEFDADDVIVVEREDAQTVFNNLNSDDLESWLGAFNLGELWEKNVLGGRPRDD